jgi:N-succinyldiaminopimelate aminotransferase
VVTDEVYEHLTFDGGSTSAVASLPGMWERTLTISSAGKTFSTTGWKVGWVSGPAEAVAAVRAVKQFLTYVGSGPFQPAVATGLGLPDEVYAGLARSLAAQARPSGRRVAWCRAPVSVPAGTYFVVADAASLGAVRRVGVLPRAARSRSGVVGVPVSVFHDDPEARRTLVRFAFCKRDEVLTEAVRRLAGLRVG